MINSPTPTACCARPCTHTVLRGGIPLLALHAGSPLLLLACLAAANHSLFSFVFWTHGQMPLAVMRVIVPVLVLQPVRSAAGGGRASARARGAAATGPACRRAFRHTTAKSPTPSHAPSGMQAARSGELCKAVLGTPGVLRVLRDAYQALAALQ